MKNKLLLSILCSCVIPLLYGGIEDMQGLGLKYVKLPFYKEKKLQLMIFSDTGVRNGQFFESHNTLLDMLLEHADIDRIPDGWNAEKNIYPLDSPLLAVMKFWKSRYDISDAVIYTGKCMINQAEELAFGDSKVYLRTPVFDLDGVGFEANFKNQVIEIKDDVKIFVRSSDMDPRKLLKGSPLPQKERIIKAFSQKLRLDQKNNKVILIGNVKVIDGNNTLTCDRLTVFMDPDKKSSHNNIKDDNKAVLDGVSRVLADGNVKLVQLPENLKDAASELQESESEHLEYDVKREIIVLTGHRDVPTLKRGGSISLSGRRIELLRHEDKMFVMQDCRIQSIVRDKSGIPLYTRKINSDRANYDGKNNIANFHGRVVAMDQTTTLHSDSLRVHLRQDEQTSGQKLDLLLASGNVRIISRSDKESRIYPGQRTVSHSTLTAKQAELNYLTNKLVFYEDVKVRDSAAALNCRRLDIFMADRKNTSTEASGAPMAAGMEGQDKTVTRMVARGDVRMVTAKDKLNTSMLTLLFRDLQPGETPSPGMIQSGGVQLTKILCDGSVVASSQGEVSGQPVTRTLKADNASSDLLKDFSEFHGQVSVVDGNTEIHCRDMYIFTGPAPKELQNVATSKEPEYINELSDDNINDDPFAMDMGENSVPARIAVTDSQDLKRIVCQKQVVLLRRDKKGKLQRAGGDKAVYTVNTREVVLTAERPNRPWLRSDGRKQFCDIIRSDMVTEDLRGIGNVVVMPDN